MDLGSVADELYGLPPGEFVSARDARASEARATGDRELATAIKSLRRPTTGAWLANLVVRERRDQLTELLRLGDDMRRAQRDLAGSDLKRLSQLRRQLLSALVVEAKTIAGAYGHATNASSLQELEETLEAAVADASAGDALLSGRLTVALRYSGFGSVDLTGAVATPMPRCLRSTFEPDEAGFRRTVIGRRPSLAEADPRRRRPPFGCCRNTWRRRASRGRSTRPPE